MTDLTVYLNGRFIAQSKANISPFDSGFLYGYGLFETLKGYSGKIFALKEHMERLKKGCSRLKIPDTGLDTESLEPVLEKLLKKNGLSSKDSYIRITVTGGILDTPFSKSSRPTLFIHCKPIDPDIVKKTRQGISAVLIEGIKGRNIELDAYKTTSYIAMFLGKIYAGDKGADEGFLVNEDKELTEGTTSNIFLYTNGRLVTPPLKSGILPGIIRGFVIKTAKDEGIPVKEERVFLNDLFKADEVFVTNSIMEVAPVIKIDGKMIGEGKAGKITKKLHTGVRSTLYTKSRL